jgi:hypothetical protein
MLMLILINHSVLSHYVANADQFAVAFGSETVDLRDLPADP